MLSQTLSVSMDIGGSSSSTADQSLCAPLLAELQLDTFPFDNNGNATCVASKGLGDAYTFALKYPLGDDPSAVNAKTDAVKSMIGHTDFPTNYSARVPSRRRLREIDGRSTGDIREIARPRRRLITVSGVAAPVAALDAEVVIVVEVLAPEPP